MLSSYLSLLACLLTFFCLDTHLLIYVLSYILNCLFTYSLTYSLLNYFVWVKVLGQLPQENFSPTPKLTLTQTLTLTGGGAIFFGDNCLVAPNSKTNPNLDSNTKPSRGQFFSGDNCPDTLSKGASKGRFLRAWEMFLRPIT